MATPGVLRSHQHSIKGGDRSRKICPPGRVLRQMHHRVTSLQRRDKVITGQIQLMALNQRLGAGWATAIDGNDFLGNLPRSEQLNDPFANCTGSAGHRDRYHCSTMPL